MRLTVDTLIIIILFLSAPVIYAQTVSTQQKPESRLTGKVVLEDSQGKIEISVIDVDTGQPVPGEQTSTTSEDWFHVAPLRALVDVKFNGGGCYEFDGHSNIRVRRVNRELRRVILQKTLDCKKLEEKQRLKQLGSRVKSSGGASTGSAKRTTGGAASVDLGEGNEPEPSTKADTKSDIGKRPSPAALEKELEAIAAQARTGQFFDTFQYKFAIKLELYRDNPELTKVLTAFRQRQTNAELFRPIGKVRAEMFNDVIRRQFDTSDEVNLDNIKLVIQEESASPNIRGSATVALLNQPLEDNFLKDIRSYYREQTPSSPIFSTSLIALGRIGEDQDKAKLYSYIVNESGSERLVAMKALALAQFIEGPEALPEGAKTLASVATAKDDDPMVRAFAARSLRPFVYQQNETALQALLTLLRDSDPAVRLEAALGLGVGKVESDDEVINRLRKIAATDPCPGVRNAAQFSLSGKSTSFILLGAPDAANACKSGLRTLQQTLILDRVLIIFAHSNLETRLQDFYGTPVF